MGQVVPTAEPHSKKQRPGGINPQFRQDGQELTSRKSRHFVVDLEESRCSGGPGGEGRAFRRITGCGPEHGEDRESNEARHHGGAGQDVRRAERLDNRQDRAREAKQDNRARGAPARPLFAFDPGLG